LDATVGTRWESGVLRLSLLGPPAVTRDRLAVHFDTRKAVALLAVLAVEGQPQPRDRLAALLWPEAEPAKARSALRRTLSVTAAALGPSLVAERSVVHLGDDVTCDVREFRTLVAAGDGDSLSRAVEVYRDEFLSGFRLRDSAQFDDWQQSVAAVLRRQFATALGALVELATSAGDLDRALAEAGRWLAVDPLHEPAHRALIRIHAWRGDRSSAMRQYRNCVHILDTELGVEPLDETKELYDAVRRNQLPAPTAAPTPAVLAPVTPTVDDLVGRDAELGWLRQAMSARTGARGVVATVTGPTGVGKTALLRQVGRLGAVDATTVALRCHPEESALAYGTLLELARGVIAAAPTALDRLPRPVRAELARLVPEAAELDRAAIVADDAAAVARLFAAVRELIVAPDSVVTLVIDDAHWLDSASSDAFAYVVRRIASTPVTLVMSWSTDTLAEPTTAMRAAGDAVGDGYGVHVPLRPFDAQTLTAIVATDSRLSSIDVQRMLADTGGLPSLVLPYLDVVRDGGDVASATWLIAQDLLEQRVSRLSQTAHQIVAAASVLTGRSDADLLRETSGRGDAETAAAIDEALQAGLLVDLPGGDGYDLSLEALRHVVLEQIGTARRRLLHERAARALERRAGSHVTPADAGAIARHLNQAGRIDEAGAWHWRAATEARALHAHEQALADVQEALLLGHPAAPGRLAEGEILIALGRYQEAISALELAAAASDSAQHGVQVDRRLADVHGRLGDYAVAEAHIAAALDQIRETGLPGVASLLADHALLAYRIGDLDRAHRDGEQALVAAEHDDDPDATANALNVLGVVAARRGRLDEAETAFTGALQHAATATDGGIAIAALNNLARLMQQQGRSDDALRTARRALEEGTRLGDRHRLAALHTNVADLLRAAGQDEAAMEHLKQSAAIFADLDDAEHRRPEIWTLVEW